MSLLHLDEYSILLILSKLDAESFLSTMHTCKILHHLCASSGFNREKWEIYIEELLEITVESASKNKRLKLLRSLLMGFMHSIHMISFLQHYELALKRYSSKVCRLLLHSAKASSLHFDVVLKLLKFHDVTNWFVLEGCGGKTLLLSTLADTCCSTTDDYCFTIWDVDQPMAVYHNHYHQGTFFNLPGSGGGHSKIYEFETNKYQSYGKEILDACKQLSYSLVGSEFIFIDSVTMLMDQRLFPMNLMPSSENDNGDENEDEDDDEDDDDDENEDEDHDHDDHDHEDEDDDEDKDDGSLLGEDFRVELIRNIKKVFQRDFHALLEFSSPRRSFKKNVSNLFKYYKIFFALAKYNVNPGCL